MPERNDGVLLTSQDAYLRFDSTAQRWQIGTEQMELQLAVQGDGKLMLESWRHLSSGTVMVNLPHQPYRIEIDGQNETNAFRYERFASGTDPDESLFLDLWLRHRSSGLLAHLFVVVYPGTAFIAGFIRIQNGTPHDIHLTGLSSLHLSLAATEFAPPTLAKLSYLDGQIQKTGRQAADGEPVYLRFNTSPATRTPSFFLLERNTKIGLTGALETISPWVAEMRTQADQVIIDAGISEGDILIPAERGRYDGVQAFAGIVDMPQIDTELRSFLEEYVVVGEI